MNDTLGTSRLGDDQRKHWVSVAAAIVDPSNRVLAIRRRDTGKWEPPGGTLEPAETILDGLRREVFEETGLEIEPGSLSGVYKNMHQEIIALVFRCEFVGRPPQPTEEAAEFSWMTVGEIEKNLDPAYACRLLDALRSSGSVVRTHDGVNLLD